MYDVRVHMISFFLSFILSLLSAKSGLALSLIHMMHRMQTINDYIVYLLND